MNKQSQRAKLGEAVHRLKRMMRIAARKECQLSLSSLLNITSITDPYQSVATHLLTLTFQCR